MSPPATCNFLGKRLCRACFVWNASAVIAIEQLAFDHHNADFSWCDRDLFVGSEQLFAHSLTRTYGDKL
jgi:hypothetical protein